jgi:hypothetical protein
MAKMYRKLSKLVRLLVVGITVSALTIDLGAAFIPSQVDHVKAATADPQSVNTDEDTPVDITLYS